MFCCICSCLSFLSSTLWSHKNRKLTYPSLSLHANIECEHRVQHIPSTAYTEYSIYCVQHIPSTACTEYSIHRVLDTQRNTSPQEWLSPTPTHTLSCQRTLLYSILFIPTITSYPLSTFSSSITDASQSTTSKFSASTFTASRLPASQSIAAISTASKYSFNDDRSLTWSVSLIMLNYGFPVHLLVHSSTASKCNTIWFNQGGQVYLQTCSNTVSQFALSRHRSVSLCSLDLSVSMCIFKLAPLCLQVHLWVHSISVSKCITNHTQSWPRSTSSNCGGSCTMTQGLPRWTVWQGVYIW